MRVNIDLINHAFQPGRAIRQEYKDLFVGRGEEIIKAVIALHTDGSAIAILGERGIGKTSLGWQIKDILSGNDELLRRNNLEIPIELRHRNCVWIECVKQFQNVEGLIIQLLLQSEYDNSSNFNITAKFKETVRERKATKRLKEIIGDELIEDFIQSTSVNNQSDTSEFSKTENILLNLAGDKKRCLHLLFGEMIEAITDGNPQQKLIIFIDELDRLPSYEESYSSTQWH
jgi:ABC-type dipeptide/oligopeptide/nickel transport system ATPase subunit